MEIYFSIFRNQADNANTWMPSYYYPGNRLTFSQLCRRRDPKSMGQCPHKTPEEQCLGLCCLGETIRDYMSTYPIPPGDGTQCGKGKHCMNGQCVKRRNP